MRFSFLSLSQLLLQGALILFETGLSKAFEAELHAHNLSGGSSRYALSRRDATNSTTISLEDEYDIGYSITINLGGVDVEVILDLGSTDLVVQANITQTFNTTMPASIVYEIGNGTGFINQATLQVGSFMVQNQSYIKLEEVQDLDFPFNVTGIMGIGPRFSSNVFVLLNGTTSAEPPLDRIISENSDVGNYLTILLSRVLDGDVNPGNDHGYFTVGTLLDGYDDILKQPKLPLWLDPLGLIVQHFETLLDADGIIGPDGQSIASQTIYKEGPRNQLKALFDSGWTFPAVPDYVAEAIYGRVPDAFLNASGPYWSIPCSYELNISFSFSDVNYPVHPLDLAVPFDLDNNTLANNTCMGTYQPYNFTQFALNGAGLVDIIMGMAFLRNVYFLADYGNLTSSFNTSSELGYMQLLSTTDPALAHREFVEVRLGGNDTTQSQPALLPASILKDSRSHLNASGDAGSNEPWYKRTSSIIAIVASSIALLLAVAGLIAYCYKGRMRSSKVPKESAFLPDMIGKASYKPLLAEAEPMGSGGQRSEIHGLENTSASYYDEPRYERA